MAVCGVVVVGSYPPLPGPATAATLAAVRRAWEAGSDVRVVSYRTGAAEISVPVTGPLAGRRLEHIRKHFDNPPEVVLGLQRGVPFSDPRPSQQMATAVGLAAAMRRFRRATLLVGEDPEIMPACFRILASAVDRFIVATPEEASGLVKRYRLKPAAVAVETVEPYPMFPDGVERGRRRALPARRRRRAYRRPAAPHDRGGQGPRQDPVPAVADIETAKRALRAGRTGPLSEAGVGARFTLVAKVGRLAKLRFDGPGWLAREALRKVVYCRWS